MFKRGMNKRAQEGGASASTIVGWVILAILLVIIVLAISGFFNPILDKFNLLPGSGVAGLVKACDSYVQLSSKTDYCSFRKVDVNGKSEYINCEDVGVQANMDPANKGAFSCDADDDRTKCAELVASGVKNPVVNDGKACYTSFTLKCEGNYASGGLNGKLADENIACPPDSTTNKALTKPITGYSGSEVCCVAP